MNRKQELIEIYNLAFEPSPEFDNRLFDVGFECCRYIVEDDRAVSMAFLFPCKITVDKKCCDALYLYAAATHPEYKKRGLMTRVLELAKSENKIVILRPANQKLIEFYGKRGFTEIVGKEDNSVAPYVEGGEILNAVSNGFTSNSGKKIPLMIYSSEKLEIKELGFIYSME